MRMNMTQVTNNDDTRPSWDEVWLATAQTIARRSRCSRAGIGAVIVTKDQRICATGYNGPAASWPHGGTCSNWCPRAQGLTALDNTYDECPSIHAEANALLYVDRSSIEGGTLYVTGVPCMQCAKLISNSGVKRIVCTASEADAHRKPELVFKYLERTNIDYTVHWQRGTENDDN